MEGERVKSLIMRMMLVQLTLILLIGLVLFCFLTLEWLSQDLSGVGLATLELSYGAWAVEIASRTYTGGQTEENLFKKRFQNNLFIGAFSDSYYFSPS